MFLVERSGVMRRVSRACWRRRRPTICMVRYETSGNPAGEVTRDKKRVVFLGTPTVAVTTLSQLLEAANKEGSLFKIVAVVTKRMESVGRKSHPRDAATAMKQVCDQHNIPQYCPEKASDAEFLGKLSTLDPDLCITAAYGHFLPPSFLKLPRYGTLNIHPSLLPKYRGAAPVQRCLENGDEITGVSVLYSVRKMDAGPILSQRHISLEGNEKSYEVLSKLFRMGTEELIRRFPVIFQPQNIFRHNPTTNMKFSEAQALHYSLMSHVKVQNEDEATDSPKLSTDEAEINFAQMSARDIHNRCRGFAEWPGVWSYFYLQPSSGDLNEHSNDRSRLLKIKIITTQLWRFNCDEIITNKAENEAVYHVPSNIGRIQEKNRKKEGYFFVTCGDGSLLALDELQPAGKKIMKAKNFYNGLRGRKLMYALGKT